MPAAGDGASSGGKLRVRRKEDAVARVNALHQQRIHMAARLHAEQAALAAGRQARAAAIEVDRLCDLVEQTDDRKRHRKLLRDALQSSIKAITDLAAVQPFEDLDAWIRNSLWVNTATALDQAREIQQGFPFREFQTMIANSMGDLELSPPASRCIVERIAGVSLPDAPPAPKVLSNALRAAQEILKHDLRELSRGGSHLAAWASARAAQDILEGAVVLYAPALVVEGSSPGAAFGKAHACLSVIAGAALVGKACEAIVPVAPPATSP